MDLQAHSVLPTQKRHVLWIRRSATMSETNPKGETLQVFNRLFHEKMNFEKVSSKSSKAGKFKRCPDMCQFNICRPDICWLNKHLTGPRHLLTQTFANFSHPCHLLTLQGHLLILSNNGDLLIQTYFTQDLKKSQEHAKRYHLKEQWKSKTGVKNDTPFYSRPPIEKTNSDPLFKG